MLTNKLVNLKLLVNVETDIKVIHCCTSIVHH